MAEHPDVVVFVGKYNHRLTFKLSSLNLLEQIPRVLVERWCTEVPMLTGLHNAMEGERHSDKHFADPDSCHEVDA